MLERVDEGVGKILAALDRQGTRAQHAGRFHQRQRRRAALAQRAADPSQGHAVGGRHPRAGLLRWPGHLPSRQDVWAGRHHYGSDRHDPDGDERSRPGRSEARWYRPRAARPGARDAAGAHPLLARAGARAPAACRSSRPVEAGIRCWRRLSLRFEPDPGERQDLAMSPPDPVADLRQRYQSWEKEVEAEAKARGRPAPSADPLT